MPNLSSNISNYTDKFIYLLHDNNKLIIKTVYSTVKEISENIKLVENPTKEYLEHEAQEIAIKIKTLEKNLLFSVVPKKNSLKHGSNYGLYIKKELVYVFNANYIEASLIKSDLENIVPSNRINFNFIFDQPIYINDDDAVEIKTQGKSPEIKKIIVSADKKNLEIILQKHALVENQDYVFVFNKILNVDHQKINIASMTFSAGPPAPKLQELLPVKIYAGYNSAEISWQLNNFYKAELFFGEHLLSYDCLGAACPLKLTTASNFINTIYFNMKSNKYYDFILRAEDLQGDILVSSGTFKSLSDATLRFSEILINPKNTHKSSENEHEFIELVYVGKENNFFKKLELVVEDVENNKSKRCALLGSEEILEIKPKDYILIVGADFDEKLKNTNSHTKIIRLPTKNICGGLPNNRPLLLKIFENDYVLDRYGGYLWEAPEGLSVVRKEPEGLDELNNYCYSDPARGPTPGGC